MRYWIFKASPDKYRLDDRMKDPLRLVTWKVNNEFAADVGIGDIAFIFRTGSRRGIVGALRVSSVPCQMEEIETERPYCTDLANGKELRVLGEIIHRCQSVFAADDLRKSPGLEGLSVFHGFQMKTTFPVSPNEALILVGLVGISDADGPINAPEANSYAKDVKHPKPTADSAEEHMAKSAVPNLAEKGLRRLAQNPSISPPILEPTEQRVWDFLTGQTLTVDELARHLELSIPQLSTALMMLEMKNVVRRLPGNRYERVVSML